MTLEQPRGSSAEDVMDGPVGSIDGDRPAQIKPGTYEVTYVRHEVRNLFGGRAMKLVVWFRVISAGPSFAVCVPKYYNVGKPDRTVRSTNTFKVGFKSDFYRDYVRLLDEIPKGRARISMQGFRGKVFRARVRFVDRDSKQQPIAECAQYSIIDRLAKE
jgi:hypothetical protein